MNISIHDMLEWFQSSCMILSLCFSLPLINNSKVVKYMQHFYWYSIVAFLLVLLKLMSRWFLFPSANTITIIGNYSILFHFIFLSLFILFLVPGKKSMTVPFTLFVLVITATLYCLITFQKVQQNSVSYAIANLGLVFYCLVYFYHYFQELPRSALFKEPSFWVITGVFFSMSTSIPINALHDYLRVDKVLALQQKKDLFSIAYLSYGTLHLFLIKAYLCSVNIKTT